MLDDCKGPRFEEVLAALSTSVIYKILAEDDTDTSVVRQLLLGKQDMALINNSILSMSYRASLTKQLSKKEELGQQYRKFGRMLDLKGHEIEQRGASNLISSREWTERSVPRRTINKLIKHLSEHWQGDPSWVNILVQGDRYRPRESLLEQPFEKIWRHVTNDTLYKIRPDNKQSLLEDLEGRVLIQNKRLEKWKQIKENMDKNAKCAGESTPPYLDESEKAVNSPCQQSQRESWILSSRQKQNRVKDDMGLKLTFNVTAFQNGKSRLKDIQRKSRPNIDGIVPTGPLILAADHELQLYSEKIAGIETPSLTTDDDSLDANSGTDCMRLESNKAARNFGHSPNGFSHQQNDLQAESQTLATLKRSVSMTHAQTVITPTPLSLAERTRLSMALISPVKVLRNEETRLQIAPVPSLTHQEDDMIFSAPFPSTGGPHRSASLLDRTRHSMSLMSATSQGRRQSSKPRVSKVYPVNQFESPGREQSLIEPAEASILEEILPDTEADYETVFKSRPKIALSPRLSPIQDGMPYPTSAAAEAECRGPDLGFGMNYSP